MAMTATMADTITHIGYRQGTTTGTPAANSYTVTLQTLTTGGLPSGTNVGSTTSTTFTPSSANDATWVWVSLGANTYSLTQGQEFAIVLQRTAATDASNKITANPGPTGFGRRAWPSCITAAAGVWSKTTGTLPMMGMKSASNVYGRPWSLMLLGAANPSFGSTTESGMAFTVPTNYCSTYKLRGIRGLISTPTTSATNDFVVTLYSSPASSPARVDQSIAMITDRFVAFNQNYLDFTTYFTSSTALTAGTQYAIGLATTTGSDANIFGMEVTLRRISTRTSSSSKQLSRPERQALTRRSRPERLLAISPTPRRADRSWS
jgi:hypothetical protein